MTKIDPEIKTLIEQSPPFNAWPLWAREDMAEVAFIKHFRRGRKIAGAGEIPHAFILLKGAVFAAWHCHDGKAFFHLGPGFGEAINLAPALAHIPLMCDFYTHQQSSILFIPHEFIREVVSKDQAVMASLLEFICKRFTRHVEQSIKRRLIDNPRGRLIDTLLYLAASYGEADAMGVRINIRLSQNDLAAMLALSRQSINKELSRLADEGVITKSYGAITITDMAGLRALDRQQSLCPPPHATPILGAVRQGEAAQVYPRFHMDVP